MHTTNPRATSTALPQPPRGQPKLVMTRMAGMAVVQVVQVVPAPVASPMAQTPSRMT